MDLYGSLVQPEAGVRKTDNELSPIVEERSSIGRSSRPRDSMSHESENSSKVDNMELLHQSEREAYLAFDRGSMFSEKAVPNPRRSNTVDERKSKTLQAQMQQSSQENPFQELSNKKEELLEKIREKFEIKSKIKLLNALKSLLEDVVILLVWVSCIYKENILSLVLFAALTFFTFSRSGVSVLIIRYTVVSIFVYQYFSTLVCLSSYNSPQPLPEQITVNGIYPNDQNFYFYIPGYFGWQKIRDPNVLPQDIVVNLNITTYAGFPADRSRLNGMWIDYSVIITVLIYFNFCNFWLLFQPTEIVRSTTSNQQMAQYIDYCNQLQQTGGNRKQKLTKEKCISDFEQQFAYCRTTETLQNFVFTYYHLFMIAFLLAVSIFNGSLLSFGYFLACMYLITDQQNLMTEYEARVRMQKVLKNFLLPYLLLDIGLNLIYQFPYDFFEQNQKWAEIIGFSVIWEIQPQYLQLGQVVEVTETKALMTSYMMKGMTFFFISTMLQILSSHEFCEFQTAQISKLQSNQNKIGRGLAYRFNNFKCNTVITQAKEVEHISKMLAHVKKLIKKRDKLYNVNKDRNNSIDKMIRKRSQNNSTLVGAPIVEEVSDYYEEMDDKEGQFDRIKFEKEELARVKAIYDEKLSKLPWFHKFYLYLRRNFVSDIFFRYSEEQLDDIVEQYQNGRTSIKSKLEIGTMYEARKEYLEQIEDERNMKVEAQEAEKMNETFANEEEKLQEDVIEDEDFNKVPKRSSSVQVKSKPLLENKLKQESQQIEEEIPIPITTEEEAAIKNQKKRLLQQSDKPWEKVDLDTNCSYKRMITRYFVIIYKIIVSFSEFFCYFWMLFATFANGGTLYLFYPIIIFGYALLLEERPGKWFWYLALVYTQFIIILNFTLMLNLWTQVLSTQQQDDLMTFLNGTNLGLKEVIYQGEWVKSLKMFIPEIMIIGSIMILIMQQTLSGVLGIPFKEFESFEDGLLRYRLTMQLNESEKRDVITESGYIAALKIPLDKNEIDKYRPKIQRRYSDADKYAYSDTVLGQPIMMRLDLDVIQTVGAVDDYEVETIKEQPKKRRLLSADAIREPGFQTPEKKTLFGQATGFVYKFSSIFWDNKFFESIFPLIKQQKPGKDFYVWLFLIEFIICLYILFFFTNMKAQQNTISTQFYNNSLSKGMVLTLFSMIFVMVIDRVIYSTHTFLAFAERTENSSAESTNQQSNIDNQGNYQNQLKVRNMSIASTVSYKNKNDVYSGKDFAQQNWLENRLAISDSESVMSANVKEFADALVPQKQQKRGSRVLRIYFLWALLVLVHYFIFFKLPNTILYCINNPQQDSQGSTINYGEQGYYCNTFLQNWYIQFFYVLWLIYFSLAAYQIQVGLPELRKGSFMVGDYDMVSCYIFRAYLAIPFIFELRTIIDWTFTTTALDVFQWMKLAQIQANFYVNKCINAGYFTKKLGEKIGLVFKIAQGFLLMLIVLALLVGPILLFSQINPVGQINGVSTGYLNFKIGLQDLQTGSKSDVQLFFTSQLTQISSNLTNSFDTLHFEKYAQSTGQFTPEATQVVQFSPASDSVWTISPPKKNLLLTTLQNTLSQTNQTIQVTADFEFGFTRVNGASDTFSDVNKVLNTTEPQSINIINGLIDQISCNKTSTNVDANGAIVTQFPYLIIINQKADQSNQLSPLATNPVYTTAFNLSYYCDETLYPNDPNSYWNLTQQFQNFTCTQNQTQQECEYQQTNQQTVDFIKGNVFFGNGFGFFVFSQKILPSYLSQYSASILVFYISVVYVIATLFRSAFVPMTWEIFIWDAPFNDDILMICQSIHIYRVQMELEKEEELYMILIDIMRSPEMIKSICGSSLKKKLQ